MALVKRLLLIFAFLVGSIAYAQPLPQLYSNTFGNKNNPALIFLHGGPGYNSFTFEASTGQRLADEGYYVIVYDQRGSGRSVEPDGTRYDFKEAIQDLSDIYAQYGVSKAILLGHSWGGTLGIMFTQQHPAKVSALVLICSPLDYQQTFKAIISNCKTIYTEKKQDNQLKYIAMLEEMDTSKLDYATYCFMHASAAGLYKAENPATSSMELFKSMQASPDANYLFDMTPEPVRGFYNSERYTMLKLYDNVAAIKKKVPVYGIYGNEDGLFDGTQLEQIEKLLGENNFALIYNASHGVFIDQQEIFLAKLTAFIGK